MSLLTRSWSGGALPRIVVGLLTVVLGVILAEPVSSTMPPITLTRADHEASLAAQAGATILIRLDENPTTGYRWTLEPHDMAVIAAQGSTYVAAAGDQLGGGGQRLFTFQAHKAGRVRLQLKLGRAWEDATASVERFTVTIQVHE